MLPQTHLRRWQIGLIVGGALAVTSIVLLSPDPLFWLAGLSLGESTHDAIMLAASPAVGAPITTALLTQAWWSAARCAWRELPLGCYCLS